MKRKALLVGINYPGTSHALRGCVNDVQTMYNLLTQKFNFNSPDIKILIDKAATAANMKKELENLVAGAQPGDVLFFHYSGHGAQMPDNRDAGDRETDRLDEILCPIDLDWNRKVVRDDDLRRVFDKVPAGVQLTVVLDCCHSGSGLDQVNQYQPLAIGARALAQPADGIANRYLPMPEHVAARVKKGPIRQEQVVMARSVQDVGLLISGCQSHQTSADAFIAGKYCGALTHYLTETLNQNPSVDYKMLIETVNKKIAAAGFEQRPELNGNSMLFTQKFLMGVGQPRIVGTVVKQFALKLLLEAIWGKIKKLFRR